MRKKRRIRRLIVATAASSLLAVVASPAMAFEPPGNEPDALFNAGPAGHPGAPGQVVAFELGTGAAWNAHFNSDQITN